MSAPAAVSFSHVAISVPDVDAAITFYEEVFGWYHIAGPLPVTRDGRGGDFSNLLFGRNGKTWTSVKMAHMSTPDRVGVELFEFAEGHEPADDLDCLSHGIFHFGVQCPEVDALIDEVVARGGERITPTLEIPHTDLLGLEKTYRTAYAKDPFGTIFEIYSHSYKLQSELPTSM